MSETKKARKLTAKQEAFCQHYVQVRNASEAARLAGYSVNSCGENGYQLLQKHSIQARLDQYTQTQRAHEHTLQVR